MAERRICNARLADRDSSRAILRIPAWILIGMARVYQYTLSPILGRHCRFHPSCSAYFIEAVKKYGAFAAHGAESAHLPLQPLEPRRLRSAVVCDQIRGTRGGVLGALTCGSRVDEQAHQ